VREEKKRKKNRGRKVEIEKKEEEEKKKKAAPYLRVSSFPNLFACANSLKVTPAIAGFSDACSIPGAVISLQNLLVVAASAGTPATSSTFSANVAVLLLPPGAVSFFGTTANRWKGVLVAAARLATIQ